jgi:hypothetical protein
MNPRIDDLNTRYLIPGASIDTTAAADPEGFVDDSSDNAPYSQMPARENAPSDAGWQDMLGLDRIAPDPTQIDPPLRSMLPGGEQSVDLVGSMFSSTSVGLGQDAGEASQKVKQMMGMLAGYDLNVRRMRARASMGSGQ